MARSRQSLKRHRADIGKRLRNRSKLNRLRTGLRRAAEAETPEDRDAALRRAQSLLDKAGRTRLIHPNKARRLQSRMAAGAASKP